VNAKDSRDIITKVWLFSELVKNKPAKGSNDYPIALKAIHLDENWKRTTLRPPKDSDTNAGLYEVAYDEDGTRITRILPDGTNVGDLLYWDGEKWTPLELAPNAEGDLLYWDGNKWAILPATDSSTLHILGIKDNVLQWVETQDCP
jgi:hypothetical protein